MFHDLIYLIIKNETKKRGINFVTHTAVKSSCYISGNINQIIFIVAEILREIIKFSLCGDNLEFLFTEDESKWILNINSENVCKLSDRDKFIFSRIIRNINNSHIVFNKNKS